jgi:hypothetical protein
MSKTFQKQNLDDVPKAVKLSTALDRKDGYPTHILVKLDWAFFVAFIIFFACQFRFLSV